MIFKDYNIIGPDSINASHGAHCANEQELFWEYHDILYSNWTGENNGWASSSNLRIFADEINVNVDKWTECMNEKTHSKRIIDSNNDAKSLQLTGTPAFFIINSNGEVSKLFGAQPFEIFEKVFDKELENSDQP
jgi:protein-disulfide isomerase